MSDLDSLLNLSLWLAQVGSHHHLDVHWHGLSSGAGTGAAAAVGRCGWRCWAMEMEGLVERKENSVGMSPTIMTPPLHGLTVQLEHWRQGDHATMIKGTRHVGVLQDYWRKYRE